MRIASPRCSPAPPEHRPALLALVLAVAPALVGCAGGRRAGDDGSPAGRGDAGDAALRAPARPNPAQVTRPAEPAAPAAGAGAVEVSVIWDDAPARLRRSPGRNACGASRAAPVQVHTLGGVAGAVVSLRPRADAPAPARPREDQPAPPALLALRQCRAWPRVVLLAPGEAVALVNDDERRYEIAIERLAGGLAVEPGKDAGERVTARIALPVVGSSAALRWPEPGVYRVAAADTEPAFVVVPDGARAGVTTALGSVRFDDVPIGSYDVIAWHPPVDDGAAPIVKQAPITVTAGQTAQSTIPLTWP
jgi:hypothetical protein